MGVVFTLAVQQLAQAAVAQWRGVSTKRVSSVREIEPADPAERGELDEVGGVEVQACSSCRMMW